MTNQTYLTSAAGDAGAVEEMRGGNVPNLLWQAITFEELRDNTDFQALPPVQELRLAGPEDYRYVRQDSDLWDALHAGVCTTSCLNGALGFFEPQAAKVLHLPRGYASHSPAMSAYHRLRLPVYTPPFHHPDAATDEPIPAAADADDSAPATASLPESSSMARKKRRRRKNDAASQVPTAEQLHIKQAPATASKAAAQAAITRERMRLQSKSRSAANRGEGSVRMAWGSAQEAATLVSLMAAFPSSSLQEVGLCWLDTNTLPPEWGFPPGTLPPLGPLSTLAADAGSFLQELQPSASHIQQQPEPKPTAMDLHASMGGGVIAEVVEVKNTCPFRLQTRISRKGARQVFVVADRGPRDQVPVQWVAQLQMEMLAAPQKPSSALLVSRSATKGITLFRMVKNEEFQRLMLYFVSRAASGHFDEAQQTAFITDNSTLNARGRPYMTSLSHSWA
ncbi:hypothetical protein WJX73_003099 [Symbiochloris irregularis]|uniref:Uncharacterized protein n=1 Tax=Symbiochloris irregularis TaxID=706552 RepID=A0AAW1NX20_9CHLO